LIVQYPDRIRTSKMEELKLSPGMICQENQVKEIRRGLGDLHGMRFPVKSDQHQFVDFVTGGTPTGDYEVDAEGFMNHPTSYPADIFFSVCCAEAGAGLERDIKEFCLDPAASRCAAWYFNGLTDALMEFKHLSESESCGMVDTSVTGAIHDFLDYTQDTSGLTLITGPSNVGAKYAAREWCQRRPGRARFVEVPPSNDEASFFRSIGKALGGNFTNYKNVQIRERVESVLQAGDIMLVLFSAQNLWPQKNLREAFPTRLAWLIDQTEKGAAVSMISGPQFFMQKRSCDKSAWDSPELQNKLSHIAALPAALTVDEMTGIARAVLAAATDADCELIAISAVGSERFLANLDAVAKRAQFLADRTGKGQVTTDHIGQAIAVVNQSETMLKAALADNPKTRKRQPSAVTARPVSSEPDAMPRRALALTQNTAPATAPRSARGGVLIHQADAV